MYRGKKFRNFFESAHIGIREQYEGKMRKYKDIGKKCEGNMKEYAPQYIGRGTLKSFGPSAG